MGRASTTAEASAGFGNSASTRGTLCELWTLEYYLKKDFTHLASRKKLPYAEVDLLFHRGESLIAVEVKSVQQDAYSSYRVKKRQRQRLKNCCLWLCAEWEGPVEFHLALVEGPGQVQVIDDFLSGSLAFD